MQNKTQEEIEMLTIALTDIENHMCDCHAYAGDIESACDEIQLALDDLKAGGTDGSTTKTL